MEKLQNTAEITEALAEAELSRIIEEESGYSAGKACAELILQTIGKAHESLDG